MIKTPTGAALPVEAIEVSMLNYERALEVFAYDPEVGVLTWREKCARKVVVGSEAGTLDSSGYRQVRVGGRYYKAHRIAWIMMNGRWPRGIDHIDGDKSNNRLSNLREASQAENLQNLRVKSTNKSGFSGVSWYKKTGSWRADIQVGGKQTYLGSFHDINDAAAAYAKAKSELHTFQPIARAS